ncbi:MAG: outer membrane beta-barrel protein [Bacteroidales bacterium]|nr:outer membrane beta-barrel protein [Bacteroidales bacterium]
MKKFISAFVIILLSTALLSAQEQIQTQSSNQYQTNPVQQKQKKNKVAGGLYLKGGVSWLMSDSEPLIPKNKANLSYGFGATMDWNFSQNFSLNIAAGLTGLGGTSVFQSGIVGLTEDRGSMIPTVGDTLTHNYKFSSSYIEIPVGIKGCTNEIGYFTYFLKLGADPMFRIKSKIKPMDEDGKTQYTIKKATHLFDIGWHVGGGFEWTLAGNTKLLVELVYLGTLLDFDKVNTMNIDKNYEQDNPKNKFNDISIKVGVVF